MSALRMDLLEAGVWNGLLPSLFEWQLKEIQKNWVFVSPHVGATSAALCGWQSSKCPQDLRTERPCWYGTRKLNVPGRRRKSWNEAVCSRRSLDSCFSAGQTSRGHMLIIMQYSVQFLLVISKSQLCENFQTDITSVIAIKRNTVRRFRVATMLF